MPPLSISIGTVHIHCCCAPPLRFAWHVGPVALKDNAMPLEVTLTNEQQVTVHATPVTPAGNPATVDGAVQFTVQDGACSVVPMDDRSATIVSGDTPGDSVVLVQADADLGQGVQTIMDTVVVHVIGAQATSLGLTAEQPELKM